MGLRLGTPTNIATVLLLFTSSDPRGGVVVFTN